MKIVAVVWRDSMTLGHWRGREEWVEKAVKEDVTLCSSVGFLFWRDDDRLVLMQSVNGDPDDEATEFSDAVVIPGQAVVSVRDLK